MLNNTALYSNCIDIFNKGPGLYNTPIAPVKKRVNCNCKKTKCLKLYCECFAAGEFCRPDCKCDGCKNLTETSDLVEKARK